MGTTDDSRPALDTYHAGQAALLRLVNERTVGGVALRPLPASAVVAVSNPAG